MESPTWSTILMIGIIIGIAVVGNNHLRSSSSLAVQFPLPPGPKGELLLGHLRIVPKKLQWLTFTQWANKYGDIIYFRILGRPIVVLNSFEHARELMERRGAMYSDRPRMVFINEMMDLSSVTFMRYGLVWRKHRRLIHQYFNSVASVKFQPHQTYEVHFLLGDLLRDPKDFWHAIRRFTASTILYIAYGHKVVSYEDDLVQLVEHADGVVLNFGAPGATPVDFFPYLRYIPSPLPYSIYRKRAAIGKELLRETKERPFDMVRKQRDAGIALPSIALFLLEDYEKMDKEDPDHYTTIQEVAAALYRAGSETTATVIFVFVLAIVMYPHVARKAQEELDRVTGNDRLPSFEDREKIPYIDCILKECLRWNPPFPLGIAHRAMKEDILNGMRIPEGALIVPNIWMMMHDEQNFADPSVFLPERFSQNSEKPGRTSQLDPAAAVFGFGRRICPGRHFADASIWLTMASVLAVFDIRPALDENECEVAPNPEFTSGMFSQPLPFNCRFVPRSAKAISLILSNTPKS